MTEDTMKLPMLPMREDVLYPGMTAPFYVGRKSSIEAVEQALERDKRIFVVTQRDANLERPTKEDLFSVGMVGVVLQIMRLPNKTLKALFEAHQRAELVDARTNKEGYSAEIRLLKDTVKNEKGMKQLVEEVRIATRYYVEAHQRHQEIDLQVLLDYPPSQLADRLAPLLVCEKEIKQQILEENNPYRRLEMVYEEMKQESQVLELQKKLRDQVNKNIGKGHKDVFLNEQLRNIQKELGQGSEAHDDFDEIAKQIKAAKMPKDVREVAERELRKLRLMSPMSAEANVIRNYLDWLVLLPWKSSRAKQNINLKSAKEILEADHYGLEKVKERIVEHLAVNKLRGQIKGPILCFVGPPGVGKTSMGRSIARAMGRKFVRMSLGGIRDESEIRGHRRTYIGAMPGKIIQAVKKAGSKNSVILLDEIDKLYSSIMGDPSAALLEVLDPEQNKTFMDHYIELEYDLSQTLFICTANTTQTIPHPLLDRMEVVKLTGYTEIEKRYIVENHLEKKLLSQHGLEKKHIKISSEAIFSIIRGYTREAGVRSLEREIAKIFRKVVTRIVKTNSNKLTSITPKSLKNFLGVPPYRNNPREQKNEIGITNGLGVTGAGGEIMITEVKLMPGSGKRHITGQLGDVMKESAEIAISFIRTNADNFGIWNSNIKRADLHIHLPEGAIPKEGASAGITLVTSLLSALTDIPVKYDIAMTGEMTLRGNILQVDGIKQKLLAAKQHNIKTVIIPADNKKDLHDIPQEILKAIKVIPVQHFHEIIPIALAKYPKPLSPEELKLDLQKLKQIQQLQTPTSTPATTN